MWSMIHLLIALQGKDANLAAMGVRERILHTAHALFYREGIRATGIDRITGEAHVTKVTFYRQFPSKHDLVAAYLEQFDWREQPVNATLFIDDDVAVQDSLYTVGRRGVAGNFFVIKAVGAKAEEGADLDEVIRVGEKVNSVTRTMGIALSSCTPPAKGEPLFEIGDDEIEVGIGIHGEPGRRRAKIMSANEIVDELLGAVVPDLPFESGDQIGRASCRERVSSPV
mgnify:CR=1 FL=1